MFKNIIIVILAFVVFSLMVQKPENVDLIVKDAATAKNMVVEGTDYVKKTFTKEFSAHENKAEEIIEDVKEKVEDVKVSQVFPSYSDSPIQDQKIIEETWFNEK